MQPVREPQASGQLQLPGLPAPTAVAKPSFAQGFQGALPILRQSGVDSFASENRPQLPSAPLGTAAAEPGKGIGRWLRPLAAVAAAGAAGVGISLGLAHFFPAIATTWVGTAAAVGGVGAFMGVQKMLAPRKPLPPVTNEAEYAAAMKAVRRGEWWKSGVLAVGALGTMGLLQIGVNLGLKWAFPTWASTIDAAISPTLWGFTNAIAGAVTFLFIQKVTEPIGAFVSRWASKGSPIQATLTPDITKALVDINQAANAVDSRALSGAISVTSFISQMDETLPAIRDELAKAEAAWDEADHAAAIDRAAAFLGGKLCATENLNFSVTANAKEVASIIAGALKPNFMGLADAEKDRLISATLEVIKKERRPSPDPRVPNTEAAIKSYFQPMLDTIVKGQIGTAVSDAH